MTETLENDNGLEATMSPEDWQELKRLQEKAKAAKKQLAGMKVDLFTELTENFAGLFSQCQKDIITVSSKVQDDGQIYSVTFGKESPENENAIDTAELAQTIIDQYLTTIEPIMGISNSMKVTGEYEGEKLYWQVRKRSSVKED